MLWSILKYYSDYLLLDSTAKQTKIRIIPIQPMSASCSPTNKIANKAATSGSNNVSIVAVLAEMLFKQVT